MRRLETSPYRKASAAANSLYRSGGGGGMNMGMGIPRRRRVLTVAVLSICVFWSFSRMVDLSQLGQTASFFLFSPEFAGRYGHPGERLSHDGGADILQFIDPLIGTANGGHVFPGASLPYGMAKPVADTLSPAENAAGFVSDSNPVLGFSHMHDSGTGGNPSMGQFPIFVHPGCPNDDFSQCTYSGYERPIKRVPGSTFASPGYFSINLTNSVRAEMTATQHVALYRFSFPGTDKVKLMDDEDVEKGKSNEPVRYSPLVLVDLADLAGSRSEGGIRVDVVEGGVPRVAGRGEYAPSFGSGRYSAYFCADFKGAEVRKSGTFTNKDVNETVKFLDGPGYGSEGAWIHFQRPVDDEIMVRVGLSFISVQQACENAETEVPDFDFQRVEKEARNAWREKLSGAIQVDAAGVSEELQTTFWSGLYRTMLSPQNYTGENPLWNSSEPYYDSFYCIWDSFRAQHPLLTILDPNAQTEMVRALIDIYRFEGKLPDCRMSFCKGFSQGGSNADIVLVDAFLKSLGRSPSNAINYTTAYEAVVSDAEIEPDNWGLHGRGNLASWHEKGYIPYNDDNPNQNGSGPASRTISRGVEYAYDDFCISLLATKLRRPVNEILKYARRGSNWRNYWNPHSRDIFLQTNDQEEILQSNFQGFMQPRTPDGKFKHQNPRTCSPIENMHSCYYDTGLDTYEGSPWLYSFFVPQDMSTLISLMDGPAGFVSRLNFFHESGISYLGNEQGFLPTFQFHYAGRPALSSYWAHRYIPSQFNASVNGIPGNDDCAMGAFSAFVAMGFFPVAGQDVYLVTPPFFREVKLRVRDAKGRNTNKWAVIRTRNFDAGFLEQQQQQQWVQKWEVKKEEEQVSSSWKTEDAWGEYEKEFPKGDEKEKEVVQDDDTITLDLKKTGEKEEGDGEEKKRIFPQYQEKQEQQQQQQQEKQKSSKEGSSSGSGSGEIPRKGKGNGKIYIQRAWLNGRPYTKNWITHDFFLNGGLLELEVGEEESDWGTREEDLPPSYPTDHLREDLTA
ncbi:glycosyl hydrolase family 92-domain-containing protein [Rhypophila decipiens]|uniref:Glycosyl hydrolase family 92-domain-containing protein n=1 Tax=Rhypophila decipiens TaxID=261697 RepID=A0AAN6YDT5_9PEZI|nr:glycosyl hydrolase family 92-domain-containing protein [Rhypophila decipiens]